MKKSSHIRSRLLTAGYEVVGTAQSSEEALEKLQECEPDLVLMDIRIKGLMDGIQTTTAMRTRSDIPVIYLTAHSDRETVERAKLTGASGFVTKPIHYAALGNAMEMALYKHRVFENRLNRRNSLSCEKSGHSTRSLFQRTSKRTVLVVLASEPTTRAAFFNSGVKHRKSTVGCEQPLIWTE